MLVLTGLQLGRPEEKSAPLYAEDQPNFVPDWEVKGAWAFKKLGDDHYHIDDHLFTTPRPAPSPVKTVRVNWRDHFYVPYSHSYTQRDSKWRDDAETVGLGEYADIIIDALNNLYSVPADGRLPLGFEPISLRRMRSKNELDDYLITATRFLESLHQAAGTFMIWDYDGSGKQFCYYASDLLWSDRDELFDKFPVTRASISWHRNHEYRRGDRYYKLIPEDIYMEFFKVLTAEDTTGPGHWYANNWAERFRKWLRVEAYLSSKDGTPQTTRCVISLDEEKRGEKS